MTTLLKWPRVQFICSHPVAIIQFRTCRQLLADECIWTGFLEVRNVIYSSVVKSIWDKWSVPSLKVVHFLDGPLLEVLLYIVIHTCKTCIHLQVLYYLLFLHLLPQHLQPPPMIYLVCIQYTWGVPNLWTGEWNGKYYGMEWWIACHITGAAPFRLSCMLYF